MPGGTAQNWQLVVSAAARIASSARPTPSKFPDDEGYVKGASTTSTASDDADPDDHYLHESLFRWTGWSLVAPPPGRTLRSRTDAASGVQGEVPEDVTDEATTGGNGLAVTFVATKNSLPKLRFGVPIASGRASSIWRGTASI